MDDIGNILINHLTEFPEIEIHCAVNLLEYSTKKVNKSKQKGR